MLHGQHARTVFPNAKCNQCLHFNANGGTTGLCVIGLQPITCGNGDHPAIGFHPVSGGGHEFGPDNTPPARSGSPRLPATPGPMLVRQVDLIGQGGVLTSLGEEVATLAKSVRASIEQNQRRDCPQHQFGTSLGMLNATVPVVRKCLCRTVSPQDLAHVVFPRLQARHKGDVRALARIIKAVTKNESLTRVEGGLAIRDDVGRRDEDDEKEARER